MPASFQIILRVVVVLTLGLALPGPARVNAQSVWELTPYRVRVLVSAANVPELRGVPNQLAPELSARLENLLGAAWHVDVAPVRGLSGPLAQLWTLPADAAGPELLPEEAGLSDGDKLLLLHMDRAVDGWRLAAREWDLTTWRLGPVHASVVRQPAKLRDTAVHLLLEVFRPLARVELVETGPEGQRAVLRLRAGRLPTRDPELQPAHAGQVFCPIVRLGDREGGLRLDSAGKAILPQPVPWTFLVAESVDGAEVPCRVQSGLSAPLSASRRGRMEQLALGVAPRPNPTRVTLLTRREPYEPASGYEVLVQRPGERATTLLGRTDRSGGIDVAPTGDPLTILLVRSGQQLLARLPIVPGFAEELIAYVPDDTQRLEAEAFATALQEQLVDAVTRRQVLIARAEAQLDAGQPAEAKKLLAQLRQLPDRELLRRRLVTRQSQLRPTDPHVRRQVEALFSDTAKLLERHLDPEPVEALARALARPIAPKPEEPDNLDTGEPQSDPIDEDAPEAEEVP